jgi:hypothetical protein
MNGDVLQKLKGPAIALIVAGSLNGVLSLLTLLSGLLRLSGMAGEEKIPTDEAERFGYYVGTFGSYAIASFSLIVAPLVIYGAVQMLNGQKYGLAKTAAILAVIPLTSCCFLVGMPIGIWALVVLGQPEIKALFRGEMPRGNFYPPQPPQSWS